MTETRTETKTDGRRRAGDDGHANKVSLNDGLDRDASFGHVPLRGLVFAGIFAVIIVVIYLSWLAAGGGIWQLGTLGLFETLPILLMMLGLSLFAHDLRLYWQRRPFVRQAREERVRQGRRTLDDVENELTLSEPGTAIAYSRQVLLGIPATEDRAHHLHLGQTGSGKTIDATWHVNLWPSAALVFDPKGAELYARTARLRAGRFGSGSIFSVNDSGGVSDSIDITNYFDLDNPVHLKRFYDVLVRTSEEKEKFWTDYAYCIFEGIRDVAKAKGVHFIDALMGMIALSLLDMHRVLQTYSPDNAAQFFGQRYKKGIDYQRAQFGAQITVVAKLATLRPFLPLLRTQTIPMDWSQHSATIYINFDLKQIATTAPMAELLIEALMRHEQDVRKHTQMQMAEPILVLLDEFPHLGIRRMSSDLATLGSLGIRYCLFAQDVAQLRATYGHDGAASIVNNCQIKVYHKTNDLATMEMISKFFGDQLLITKTKSSSWTETLSHRSAPALTVAQIASLKMTDVIIHTGMVKAICQRLPPFTANILTWMNGGQPVILRESRTLPPAKPIQPLRFDEEGGEENMPKPQPNKPW